MPRFHRPAHFSIPDQPLVEAAIHYTIGNAYRSIGDFEEAEKHRRRALELRRRELGLEDSSTLRNMNDLAVVFQNQGRYDEAERLQQQTLEVKLRRLGQELPATLDSMCNLATLYHQQGLYEEAEQLSKRTLGDEHPDTLRSVNYLAVLYQNQGRYHDAAQLHHWTLELLQRTLGNEHPHHDIRNGYLQTHDRSPLVGRWRRRIGSTYSHSNRWTVASSDWGFW